MTWQPPTRAPYFPSHLPEKPENATLKTCGQHKPNMSQPQRLGSIMFPKDRGDHCKQIYELFFRLRSEASEVPCATWDTVHCGDCDEAEAEAVRLEDG